MASKVKLKINQSSYEGWKDVNIRRNLGAVAGGFDLNIVRAWSGDIFPQNECSIFINDKVVISGYVDNVNISTDSSSDSFSVSGRDYTGQLVDCSAVYKTGSWRGVKIDTIIKNLISPFGIDVVFNGDLGPVFKKFVIQQGETVFECIDRACKIRGLITTSNFKGQLLITDGSPVIANDSLVYGENLKDAEVSLSLGDRFSDYIVKGSSSGNDWVAKKSYSFKAETKDDQVTLYRPLVVIPEGLADTKSCQLRGDFEANIRAAKSSEVNCTVQGWFQDNGDLWDVNMLVDVNISKFSLSEQMIITECVYSFDDSGGEIVKIKVMREDVLDKLPLKKVKKRSSSFGW